MIWITLVIVVAASVLLLPEVVKRQIETRGTSSLGQKVSLGYLSFNLFTGRIDIKDLSIGEETVLSEAMVSLNMLPLIQQRIELKSVFVSGVKMPVSISDTIEIAGVALPASSNESEPLSIQIEQLQLEDLEVRLSMQGLEQIVFLESAQISQFDLSDFTDTQVHLIGQLNTASVEIRGALKQFGFDGQLQVQSLQLAPLNSQAYEGVVSINQQANVSFQGNALTGSSRGTLSVSAIKTPFGDVDEGQMEGGIDLAGNQIRFDGQIRLTELALEQIAANEAMHSGQITIDTDQLALSLDHTLEFQNARLSTPQGAVAIDQGDWRGLIQYKGLQDYKIEGSSELRAIEAMTFGQIGQLTLSELDLVPNGLKLGELNVSNANMLLRKDQQGVLVGVPSSTTEAEDDSTMPALYVRKISIQASKFEFFDESVEPLVDIEMRNINSTVTDFSLLTPFKFEFVADHQEEKGLESQIKVTGDYDIAASQGAIEAQIANFELHEIAPYLGNGIRSGRLNIESMVELTPGRLKAANDVKITKVKVDETSGGGGDQMSLSTALFLLKDKQDVVELKVPVETDFKNVDVDFDDIVQTAMLKAARTTAVTYAQYALQPYGSLLLAKDMLGAMTRPRFEPIKFETDSAELSQSSTGYIEKLAELLTNKSDLTVTVCGFSSTQELLVSETPNDANLAFVESTQEEKIALLKNLAQQRGQNVRDHLHGLGVSRERLYACTATVEAKKHMPRVELAL